MWWWIKNIQADVNYDVKDYTVNVDVQKNGSLIIKRHIRYDFPDEAHGVYYRQNLESNQQISQTQVWINGQEAQQNDSAGNNTYKITKLLLFCPFIQIKYSWLYNQEYLLYKIQLNIISIIIFYICIN